MTRLILLAIVLLAVCNNYGVSAAKEFEMRNDKGEVTYYNSATKDFTHPPPTPPNPTPSSNAPFTIFSANLFPMMQNTAPLYTTNPSAILGDAFQGNPALLYTQNWNGAGSPYTLVYCAIASCSQSKSYTVTIPEAYHAISFIISSYGNPIITVQSTFLQQLNGQYCNVPQLITCQDFTCAKFNTVNLTSYCDNTYTYPVVFSNIKAPIAIPAIVYSVPYNSNSDKPGTTYYGYCGDADCKTFTDPIKGFNSIDQNTTYPTTFFAPTINPQTNLPVIVLSSGSIIAYFCADVLCMNVKAVTIKDPGYSNMAAQGLVATYDNNNYLAFVWADTAFASVPFNLILVRCLDAYCNNQQSNIIVSMSFRSGWGYGGLTFIINPLNNNPIISWILGYDSTSFNRVMYCLDSICSGTYNNTSNWPNVGDMLGNELSVTNQGGQPTFLIDSQNNPIYLAFVILGNQAATKGLSVVTFNYLTSVKQYTIIQN